MILHAVVLVFYAADRQHPGIDLSEASYFFTYALAAFVINYWLLPRYAYRKKYIHFLIGLLLLIAAAIIAEEFVLEQIFYPERRGKTFSGVFYTMLDVMPVITILTGFKFGWDALTKQQEVDQLRLAVQESELKFLQSQLHPHFLFNNLNNLYAYAIEQSDKTPQIILELSSVLRYMLYECKEKFVPLNKEMQQLENFIRLNELQIEERGKVTVNFPAEGHDFRIAPLILLAFIENAFKHSQSGQSEGIMIDVNIQLTKGGVLTFNCRNNYQADTATKTLAGGIGLANVRKRLELLYPSTHQLNIRDEGGYYEVELRLELCKTTRR